MSVCEQGIVEWDFLDYFVMQTSNKPKKTSMWTIVEHLELLYGVQKYVYERNSA